MDLSAIDLELRNLEREERAPGVGARDQRASAFAGRASHHFLERVRSRKIPRDLLDFVLLYGTGFHRRGLIHYTVVRKHLPPGMGSDPRVERALDWIVLVSEIGTLITCYRHTNAVRFLRRKPKRRTTHDSPRRRCDGPRSRPTRTRTRVH